MTIKAALVVGFCAVAAIAMHGEITQPQGPFDVVLAGGRVMDPGSNLDATRHVGIQGGRITAVSATPLNGRMVVDVSGLVVAPGFIDPHAHSQSLEGNRF